VDTDPKVLVEKLIELVKKDKVPEYKIAPEPAAAPAQ